MSKRNPEARAWSWEATVAVCSFGGGILAGLIGSLLTAMTWLFGVELHPWLRGAGTALLIATIPLLIFSGYCLDWMESKGRKSKKIAVVSASCGLLLAIFSSIQAQQTIFNVPNTDVLEKGKVYGELDVSFKPSDSGALNRFTSFVPRMVVGAGSSVEIGLNVTGNIQPGPDSTTLVPTIKWKPFQGKNNGWAFVVGDNLFVPVRNRSYNAGNYVYAELSKTLKRGTRVTFGGYDFTRNVVAPANRAGGQFGFEQPINNKISIAADWLTGKHSAGYFTPGLIFKAGPKVTGYAGYSIGNQNLSNGNHFFLLELGYNLN